LQSYIRFKSKPEGSGSATANKKRLLFSWNSFLRSPMQTATFDFQTQKKSGKTATQKLPFAGLKGISSCF